MALTVLKGPSSDLLSSVGCYVILKESQLRTQTYCLKLVLTFEVSGFGNLKLNFSLVPAFILRLLGTTALEVFDQTKSSVGNVVLYSCL